MVEASVEKYSVVTGIQKAISKTIWQNITWGIAIILGFAVANPALIAQILGSWSNMTVLQIVVLALNFAINWLKNRNLGNA